MYCTHSIHMYDAGSHGTGLPTSCAPMYHLWVPDDGMSGCTVRAGQLTTSLHEHHGIP